MVRYVKGLPNVVYAEESIFVCSIDATTRIRETVKEERLNRVVVAACTPRTHEPVFQETIREAGLNRYLFEMVNIREQCSWVHAGNRVAATKKAQELVRMAVAKASRLKPLKQLPISINHSALVVGGGISGMVCALSLAEQGFEVHLVERSKALGGVAQRIQHTLEGGDVQEYLRKIVGRVYENPLVHVYVESNIIEAAGFVGNFTTKISVGSEPIIKEISHGVTIIATGGEEYKPTEYLYGKDPKVLTLLELEEKIAQGDSQVASASTIIMILCVGSRDSERPYCSRVCCGQAIKNALKLKEMNPEVEIYVLYRDMRTYGLMEDYYRKAADMGVTFVRYDVDDKPEAEVIQENGQNVLRVSVTDPILGQRLMIDTDLLVLATATVASNGNKELSQLFKLPLNEDGYFMEAHMKLRPVDFASDGIFMCGLAHSPKFISESIAQAQAAVSRAILVLAKDTIMAEGIVCTIDKEKCNGCGLCIQACYFGAISYNEKLGVSEVNPVLCKGCGNCAVICPSGVCQIGGFRNEQILSQVEAYI